MSKLVFAFVLCASAGALAACKPQGSAKLEGRWRGVRAEGVPTETQAQANTFALGTEIIAKGDQIVIATPAGRNPQSTYVVDAEDKTAVTIHTDKDGVNARETFTFASDGKTMSWKIDDRRAIVFQKVADK